MKITAVAGLMVRSRAAVFICRMMRKILFVLLLVVGIKTVGAIPLSKTPGVGQAHIKGFDGSEVLVVIDGTDTVTAGSFERAFSKNCIGTAQEMSARDFFDEFLTFRLNIADAKTARIDTLPEYRLGVAAHMMSLVQPELPPHLAAMITSQDDDVVADIVAAIDSVYNARSDIREAVNEYGEFMLTDYVIEGYLEKEGMNNPDSLSRFFEGTRGDYNWDEPRFKGYVICVTRAENPDEAEMIIERTGGDMDRAIPLLRSAYGRNVRIGHVVMPEGTNDIVDYVAFGGPRTDNAEIWSLCRAVGGRIIAAPESFEDVRGTVSERFREKLLERRNAMLREVHNVKINQNALKKIESLSDNVNETSSAQNK